jgi:hypothetical protein
MHSAVNHAGVALWSRRCGFPKRRQRVLAGIVVDVVDQFDLARLPQGLGKVRERLVRGLVMPSRRQQSGGVAGIAAPARCLQPDREDDAQLPEPLMHALAA